MLFNRIKNMLTRILRLEQLTSGARWASYNDTQYTTSARRSISADTRTKLTNNGVGGPKSYEGDTALYDVSSDTITGIEGETRLITIDLVITPTAGSTASAIIEFDIGGTVGALYPRLITFPKGSGVERQVTFTVAVYTLDTWEANGAEVYITSEGGTCTVHDYRVVIID